MPLSNWSKEDSGASLGCLLNQVRRQGQLRKLALILTGRRREFLAARKRIRQESPAVAPSEVFRRAWAEMGMATLEDCHQACEQSLLGRLLHHRGAMLEGELEEIRMERAREAWDTSLDGLRQKAEDLPQDLEWIYLHPAMHQRPKDPTKDISLTLTDISPKGYPPAPNRGAVAQLQYWVNHKKDFFELIMKHQLRKDQSAPPQAEERHKDSPAGLAEIQRMIEEAMGK